MTSVEICAFFGSAFLMGGVCAFIYWFTGWQDRHEATRRATAHTSSGSSPSSSIPKPDRPT